MFMPKGGERGKIQFQATKTDENLGVLSKKREALNVRRRRKPFFKPS